MTLVFINLLKLSPPDFVSNIDVAFHSNPHVNKDVSKLKVMFPSFLFTTHFYKNVIFWRETRQEFITRQNNKLLDFWKLVKSIDWNHLSQSREKNKIHITLKPYD